MKAGERKEEEEEERRQKPLLDEDMNECRATSL